MICWSNFHWISDGFWSHFWCFFHTWPSLKKKALINEETAQIWEKWEWVWYFIPKQKRECVRELSTTLLEMTIQPQLLLPFTLCPSDTLNLGEVLEPSVYPIYKAWHTKNSANFEVIHSFIIQNCTQTVYNATTNWKKYTTFTAENMKLLRTQWNFAAWLATTDAPPDQEQVSEKIAQEQTNTSWDT